MACPFLRDPVDEGARIIQRALRQQVPRILRPRLDPYHFPDDYLYERYRFSRRSLIYLCKLLEPVLVRNTRRSRALTVAQSVCIALRYFASGFFLYSVGDAEHLSKATVCREIRKVYMALKSLLNIFITFPGHRGILSIKDAFFGIDGFPDVIGVIDCTHVKIKAPTGPTEANYINPKSYHSINVQMVCTADQLISNIVAKWPGSVHDARIFRESSLAQSLREGMFPGVLLGDRGYPCLPHLLTPYANPETQAERLFNRAHCKTRACIELTFSILKSRFNCLQHLRVTPERACDIVVACAVLHNVAKLQQERMPTIVQEKQCEEEGLAVEDDMDGRAVRAGYTNTYFG